MGSEWKSRAFKRVVEGIGAKHYTVQEGDHHAMGLLDRCERTIKQLVARYLMAFKTKKWIDVIPSILKNY